MSSFAKPETSRVVMQLDADSGLLKSVSKLSCTAILLVCILASNALAAQRANTPAVRETSEIEGIAEQIRQSAELLDAYPQHKGDVAELSRLVDELETTSAKIAALEANANSRLRSPSAARAAMLILVQLRQQSADREMLQRKLQDRQKADASNSDSKVQSDYATAVKQFRSGLAVMEEAQRQETRLAQQLTQ